MYLKFFFELNKKYIFCLIFHITPVSSLDIGGFSLCINKMKDKPSQAVITSHHPASDFNI